MKKIHKKLSKEFSWYYRWHRRRAYHVFHWAIFLLIAGLFLWEFFILVKPAVSQEFFQKGRIFYVDSVSGADENAGLSQDQPWRSFAKLASMELKAGDTVLLKTDSVFPDPFLLENSGKLGRPIIFSSYGEGEPPRLVGIKVAGQNYITIKNFRFSGALGEAMEIFESGNITVSDCEFTQNRGTAMRVTGSKKIRIHGNYFFENNTVNFQNMAAVVIFSEVQNLILSENSFTKNVGSGLDLRNISSAEVNKNKISHNAFSGITVVNSENIFITQNDIFQNGQSGEENFGINLARVKNIEFTHNLVAGQLGQGGMRAFEGERLASAGNLFYGNQGLGMSFTNITDMKVYNNTIYGLGGSRTVLGMDFFGVEGKIFNNITFDILGQALQFSGNEKNVEFNHNNWISAGNNISWNGKLFEGLEEFYSATGFGKNSKSDDPKFVDIFTRDFHLDKNSSLIDAGFTSILSIDFDGISIPQGKQADMGAFEFIQ